MKIQLSEHFTYRKLLRFTLPSIVMMVFTSIYGVVDGIFVSNFAGKTAFSALNFIMPVCMIPGAIGFMLGTGGSALVARLLGEGRHDKARRVFSMLIYVSVGIGAAVSLLVLVLLRPIAMLLGAEGEMLDGCVVYGSILMIANTAFVLQNEFQSFLVAAEKPQFGLAITVAAGLTNIALDAILVGVFRFGLAGAAIATGISQLVGGMIPLVYFIKNKNNTLHLVGWQFDGRALIKACTNGSSEMLTNLSMSLVNILYNFQLMRLAGEDGIAAYGVIMYINFVFVSIFIGYSVGSAPIISYHYGAENIDELKNLRKKSFTTVGTFALCMAAASFLSSYPLSMLFVGYDEELFRMTLRAFYIYSFSYLFCGFNIFGSAFFTALNNGGISALISFARTLLFQVLAVSLLPLWLKLDGVWLSIVVAEILALCVTLICVTALKKKYRY